MYETQTIWGPIGQLGTPQWVVGILYHNGAPYAVSAQFDWDDDQARIMRLIRALGLGHLI